MSTPITINVPHKLGAPEARRRIDEGFGELEKQFGGKLAQVERRWNGDRLDFSAKALGQQITGWMFVAPTEVRMEVVLPGVLGLVAAKIQRGLKKQGALLLEDKRP